MLCCTCLVYSFYDSFAVTAGAAIVIVSSCNSAGPVVGRGSPDIAAAAAASSGSGGNVDEYVVSMNTQQQSGGGRDVHECDFESVVAAVVVCQSVDGVVFTDVYVRPAASSSGRRRSVTVAITASSFISELCEQIGHCFVTSS